MDALVRGMGIGVWGHGVLLYSVEGHRAESVLSESAAAA